MPARKPSILVTDRPPTPLLTRLLGWLCCLLASSALIASETETPSAAAAPETIAETAESGLGKVGYVHIDGPIDRNRTLYQDRALQAAEDQGIDTLIVHINTDGGAVFAAREMLQRQLTLDGDIRLIAYVDFRAISAGAMIAYGCDELYIARQASIGDIGVIFMKPDGEVAYAPEKFEAPVRALMSKCAEVRGWNEALLLKMVARNQVLYRATLADGTRHWVIEDDWPEFLADHPDIDPEDTSQVIVRLPKDRLLTMTGTKAMDYGMASGLVDSLDELYTQLEINKADVIDLSPTDTEEFSWAMDGYTGLLMGLAVLFVLMEIKTPGVGLWITLGAICFALFLLTSYSLEILNHIELFLMLLGLALLIVELTLAWGGGLLGILGVLIAATGLFMAVMPNEIPFDWTDDRLPNALGDAITQLLAAGVVAGIGLLMMIAALPHLGVIRRLGVETEIGGTSAGTAEVQAADLQGREVEVAADLHPVGTIVIDGVEHSARSEHGSPIEAGTRVTIVSAQFGEYIVRRTDGGIKA